MYQSYYSMKAILSMIQRFWSKELPKPMGRWNNEYCQIKTNQKVDLSNEDHCGPCGEYGLLSKKKAEIITEKSSQQKKII